MLVKTVQLLVLLMSMKMSRHQTTPCTLTLLSRLDGDLMVPDGTEDENTGSGTTVTAITAKAYACTTEI